jgi:type IV secretory pathway VirB10-like protein
MKVPARIVACVLPLFLAGCIHWPHKEKLPPPPPTISPSTAPPPTQLPPPEVTIPTTPPVNATKLPEQTPKPPAKHRKQPSAPEAQQTSNGAPAVSAIGQLSSRDASDSRRQTQASIDATERSLNGIKRNLSDQDQKTVAHIREFLKQAKDALTTGDIDGATTLVAKAKVLLNELLR